MYQILCRIITTIDKTPTLNIFDYEKFNTHHQKMYFRIKFIPFLLIFALKIYSQDNYNLQWYSADSNHLPQNSVKSIIKDKYGYIWLATENGVVRYDGKNFKIYNSENVNGLLSNRIHAFSGNPGKDSIYFLNESKQLFTITNREIISLKKHVNQPYANIKEILSNNYQPVKSPYFTDNNYFTVLPVNNNLYIIKNDSVSHYNNNRKLIACKPYNYAEKAQFFTLNNNLYHLSANGSLVKVTVKEKEIASEILTDIDLENSAVIYTNSMAGQVFISSNNSLYRINEINDSLKSTLLFKDFDLDAHNIMAVYYDEENHILYLGSANKGLLIIKKQSFSTIHNGIKHEAGTNGVYYSLISIDKESVLASTGEVLSKQNKNTHINIGPYSDKYLLDFDNNGDLWTKNFGKLYRFTKNSNFREHESWQLNNSITSLKKGADGKIWVATFNDEDKGGLLYLIDPSVQNPSPKLFLRLSFVPSALNIPDNKTIWAGSWHGLFKIDIESKAEKKINDFPQTHVRSLYVEKTGELWACSYSKGFFLHNNGKTTRFPVDRNQYLLTTHCIVEDVKGFFWITTNRGLFQVKKQDLYEYESGRLENVYYHHYSKDSGFSNNEFNGGCDPCGVYLRNKTMYFPSMDGVVYFNVNAISPRLPDNPIYIDEIRVADSTYTNKDKICLHQNFDRITFYISTPYYGNPYNETIEIKLEGPVSQKWSYLSDNSITFSTLPPGEYILKARKLNGFGSQWTYKNVYFEVLPAFWQTSWFFVLICVIGIIIIFLIIKLRLRYIRRKNILLENKIQLRTSQLQETVSTLRVTKNDLSKQITNHKRLIKSITHDIKSPLKFMSVTGRYVYNHFDSEKDESIKENIKAMYTSSHQLYHFVDNFLEYARETDIDNSRSEPYSLSALATEKINFFLNLANFKKTELINNIQGDIQLTINRHLLAIILHNLLDNAIKHTLNGSIEIGCLLSGDEAILITITDTGTGMNTDTLNYYKGIFEKSLPPENEKTGMGLHMIAELLIILGGTLKLESDLGKGTTISLYFTNAVSYGKA